MVPALALVLAAALGAEARVDAGIRMEARERILEPPPTPAERDALDLTVQPRLTLTLTGAMGWISAMYQPRVTASDVGPDLRWDHVHEGEARLHLGSGPTWSLEGYFNGAVGRTDLITENRTAGGGAGGGAGTGNGTSTIGTVSTVNLERQRAGGTFRLAPDRRTELILTGAASQDGGTDASSRTVLPVARGIEATAELRRSTSRLDTLGLRLAAAEGRIASLDTDSAWASAMATWRRRLSPQVDLWSGAGAVALQSRVPPPQPPGQAQALPRERHDEVHPAAELGISRSARLPELPEDPGATPRRPPLPRLDTTWLLASMLGASLDRLTALAVPELDVRGELRWPLSPVVALAGRGSGALAWPQTGRTWRGQAELGPSFQLSQRAVVDLGGYVSWQNSGDPAVLDYTEYGAFLRLSADAPPLTR